MKKRLKKAFTLLELIIALTILGIIMAILINVFGGFSTKGAKVKEIASRLNVVAQAFSTCYTDKLNCTYCADPNNLENYLSGNVKVIKDLLDKKVITINYGDVDTCSEANITFDVSKVQGYPICSSTDPDISKVLNQTGLNCTGDNYVLTLKLK